MPSTHTALVHWQRADGGATVPAFSDPAAVDPEEAFVATLSSCHMLWFLHLAAKAGWVIDSCYIANSVTTEVRCEPVAPG